MKRTDTARSRRQEQEAAGRRVRVINPKSPYYGAQGIIPGMMTPEDNLQVTFPSIACPVYFRRDELEEADE